MSSLDEILGETLVIRSSADSSAKLNDYSLQESLISTFPFSKTSLWSWKELAIRNGRLELKGLSCKARGKSGHKDHHAGPSVVCTKIAWEPFRVFDGSQEILLPIDDQFLLRGFYLNRGAIGRSEDPFFRAARSFDASFLLVLGYEIQDYKLHPIAPDTCLSTWFMPHLSHAPWTLECIGNTGGLAVYQEVRWRIIVCLSLACANESSDFEPSGMVSVARFFPHAMVMSNRRIQGGHKNEAKTVVSKISMERPATSSAVHYGLPIAPNSRIVAPKNIMNGDMCLSLYTDQNVVKNGTDLIWRKLKTVYLDRIRWNDVFDYYKVDPLSDGEPGYEGQKIIIVDPERSSTRSFSNEDGLADYISEDEYTRHKLPHQGEFDNIHIAPTMRYGRGISYAFAGPNGKAINISQYGDAQEQLGLDKIYMAPVCAHDCLHTHWRWGDLWGEWNEQLKGWGEKGPNTVDGAPHVPMNQKVAVVPFRAEKGGPGFTIDVTLRGSIEPCDWQVINPQGSAYALHTSWLGNEGAQLRGGWAMFYWDMRYDGDIGSKKYRLPDGRPIHISNTILKRKERIQIQNSGALKKLRDL